MCVRRCRAPVLGSLVILILFSARTWASEPRAEGVTAIDAEQVSVLDGGSRGAEATPTVPPLPSRSSQQAFAVTADASPVNLKSATGRFTMLAGHGDNLGMDLLDGEVLFTLRELENLTFGPSAGIVFLDGPRRVDLPSRLYTTQFELRWFGQIAEPVFYELAFIPAIFTDGENIGSDAIRLQMRAVGYLAFSEQTQLVLGATYLDREDVPLLPIFGLLYSPREDIKLEFVFPRPRVLKRISADSAAETWIYAAGELGGGSWAIERKNGRNDIASYRDYRLLFGLEQRQLERWTGNIEAGYVFGRELEYESGRGDYSPDSTLILRLALSH